MPCDSHGMSRKLARPKRSELMTPRFAVWCPPITRPIGRAPGRAGLYLGIYLRHDERPWSIDVAGPVDAFRHRPQVQPVVRWRQRVPVPRRNAGDLLVIHVPDERGER